MTLYVATRTLATRTRQYEGGDLVDVSRLTSEEWVDATESGALVPARFVGTAAELVARNPVPGPGVPVINTTTGTVRWGTNGATAYNALPDAYAQVFTVPAPTGVAATDTANALASIARAVAAGGGVVRWQPGTYILSQAMPTRSNITNEGCGMGLTILRPSGSHCWDKSGTALAPIVNAHWRDMTWDGQDISVLVTYKGQYSTYLSNCTWTRVECKDFTATGFGSDFLRGCRYTNCTATGNGRGQAVGDPGMSGFGVGTGALSIEDTIIEGCTAKNNKNYGIFFESQSQAPATTYASQGVRIIGNYCEGNAWGISDAGCTGAVINGNQCNSNTYDGIIIDSGTGVAPGLGVPGRQGAIVGNTCRSNGQDGIHFDYSKNSTSAIEATWVCHGNVCSLNTRSGIRIDASRWASDNTRGLSICENMVYKNAATGIYVTTTVAGGDGGGAVHDLLIEGNHIYSNGTAAGADRHGVRVLANTTRLTIFGNKITDWQAVKTQAYGVVLDAGYTTTDAVIVNNDLRSNLTGPVSIAATLAGSTDLRDNWGAGRSFGFPATVDTQILRATTDVVTLANGYALYSRVQEGGQISKIAIQVGTQNGNICVGVYRNVGDGRSAVPTTRVATSGSVACPAAGYAEVALGGNVTVLPGDWLAISADNNTATFQCLLAGSAASSLGSGRTYQDAAGAFPLPASPVAAAAILGKSIVMIGVP